MQSDEKRQLFDQIYKSKCVPNRLHHTVYNCYAPHLRTNVLLKQVDGAKNPPPHLYKRWNDS